MSDKTAKKPTPVVERKDKKNVVRGEAPEQRNEIARAMFMRSWGGGKHHNPQDYARGKGRNPKHKGQRSDRSWEGMTSPMARFEEGVSADPTVNMTPEQAAEWKKQNAIHRDEFTGGEAMMHPEARFEKGKPADPTANMSPDDAAEWERQNEAHKDEFTSKAAAVLAAAWGPVLSRVADLADETCWEGYEAYGFKEKDGQSVPNCVPVKKASHPLDRVRGHQLWPATVARKVPALYSQEKVEDPIVWVKLFSPYTNAVWYITEYDPSSGEAFGWADLGMGGGELGYISIRELEGKNEKGLPLVERDLYWKPMSLSRAKSSRTASEKKAATGGHHYVAPNGKVYVDTAFLNSIRGIPGTAVEHMGFGEFYADTPHGRVDFDRMRGVDFPGQSGRSHLLSGEGDSAKWLLQQMISKGHTEAASDDTRMASTEGRTARLMSRQEAILQKYLADAARSGIRAATGYDELPDGVRAALHRVKDQETLWSDVDRWFADNAPATRFRFAKFPEGVEMTVDEVAKVVGPEFKEMNENPPKEVVALREEMTGGKKASRDPLVAAWGNLMEKVGASGDTWGRQLGELQNDFINDVASALKETLEMEGFTVKSAQARGSTAAVVGVREGVPVSIALQWSGGGSVSIDSVMSLGDENRRSNFPVISYTAENVASQALYKHFEGLLP